MVTPAVKREAVAHLRSAFGMSERRACRTIGCVRMTMRYCSRRGDDIELRLRLRALAHEGRRFGYRRLHVLLRREGFKVNHKRLFRLYREERLMVRRRGGRKRAFGTRVPMLVPQLPNERWSLDFVADQFIDGRRMHILVVVDDCTRECLLLVADTSISGIRVARELDRLLGERGNFNGHDDMRITRIRIRGDLRAKIRETCSGLFQDVFQRASKPPNHAGRSIIQSGIASETHFDHLGDDGSSEPPMDRSNDRLSATFRPADREKLFQAAIFDVPADFDPSVCSG
jgi:hypothetical protein